MWSFCCRVVVVLATLLEASNAFVALSQRQVQWSLRSTPEEVESIWRTHSRPLLRVGRNGVQASHKRSLEELLSAHGYVCVKINGCSSPEQVATVAEALRPPDAQVLKTKGVTVLYAKNE